MTVTQADIDLTNKVLFLPSALLLNFGLFQFLLLVFHKRRHEPSIRLLLGVAFIGFACLVPGAHPNDDLVRNLNGISEVCSVLSFLLQITTLTRDVNKKFKIATVARLARAAEVLVVLSFGVLLVNIVDIVTPVLDKNTVELVDMVTEYVSLFFVVGFRFYFLSMAHGAAKVWRSQRREVLFYVMFATHAAPFQVLSYVSGLDLHHAQGLWMRCTTALCLSSTIRARLSSLNSKGSQSASKGKGKAFETGPPTKTLVPAVPSSKLTSIHPTPT